MDSELSPAKRKTQIIYQLLNRSSYRELFLIAFTHYRRPVGFNAHRPTFIRFDRISPNYFGPATNWAFRLDSRPTFVSFCVLQFIKFTLPTEALLNFVVKHQIRSMFLKCLQAINLGYMSRLIGVQSFAGRNNPTDSSGLILSEGSE